MAGNFLFRTKRSRWFDFLRPKADGGFLSVKIIINNRTTYSRADITKRTGRRRYEGRCG